MMQRTGPSGVFVSIVNSAAKLLDKYEKDKSIIKQNTKTDTCHKHKMKFDENDDYSQPKKRFKSKYFPDNSPIPERDCKMHKSDSDLGSFPILERDCKMHKSDSDLGSFPILERDCNIPKNDPDLGGLPIPERDCKIPKNDPGLGGFPVPGRDCNIPKNDPDLGGLPIPERDCKIPEKKVDLDIPPPKRLKSNYSDIKYNMCEDPNDCLQTRKRQRIEIALNMTKSFLDDCCKEGVDYQLWERANMSFSGYDFFLLPMSFVYF
jgi:hypothetical protein